MAREQRYGQWANRPQGTAEDKSLCIESVCGNERGDMPHQCRRKRGHGPDGLYCRPHAEKFNNQVVSIWYKTNQWQFEIEPVNVIKETANRLIIKTVHGQENTKKDSTFGRYWPSYAAALAHLRHRIKADRGNLKRDEILFAKLEKRV